MAQAVTNFLNGLIPVGLNFIAVQSVCQGPAAGGGWVDRERARNVALNARWEGDQLSGGQGQGLLWDSTTILSIRDWSSR